MNSCRCNSGTGDGANADEHFVECTGTKAGGGAQYYLAETFAIICAVQSVIGVRLRFLIVFYPGPCKFQEDTSKVDPAKLEELRKAIKLREDVRYLQSLFGCVQYLRPTIFLAGGGRAKAACKDSSSFCASNYVHCLVFFMFHDVCVFRPTISNKPNERRFRRRRN